MIMLNCVRLFYILLYIGKGLKQITENPEVQEKMKKQLEELKESEISKKGMSAFETVKNDEQTKKVLLQIMLEYSLWKKERR